VPRASIGIQTGVGHLGECSMHLQTGLKRRHSVRSSPRKWVRKAHQRTEIHETDAFGRRRHSPIELERDRCALHKRRVACCFCRGKR
jgi:hypothetical protein